MKLAPFCDWALQTLTRHGAPAITFAVRAVLDGAPYGMLLTLAGGAQLEATWLRVAPLGQLGGAPVTGPPAPALPMPDLPARGRIRPAEAERFIAAVLTREPHPQIAQVTTYTDDPTGPAVVPTGQAAGKDPCGVRVHCHSGAQILGVLRLTAPPSPRPDARSLQTPAAAGAPA